MPGQGKTALAQLVYKNDKVVNHFEHRIWVCVSEDFNIERLLNEMVQSITGTNPNLTNREALIKKLQETLKGKRYLLVLDDVWNEDQEKWGCMENDLREIGGSRGTKVMVTTRSDTVASTLHASRIHPLCQLSDNDSWTLFKQRAFAEGGVVETPEFVAIGRTIVQRCRGVPLAIKALGSLLYSKKDVGEWLIINNSDVWSSSNNAGGVLSSIKLSYNHLPSLSLKQCFAYCAIYPKDTLLRRENLIQLWMAQGYLNPQKWSPLQMEDLGNNYFDILLWNSLLQEPTYDGYNKIHSCKMHDIVHDFALHISKDYCITMKAGQDYNDIKAVHLSLISSEGEKINTSQGISPNLRTLYLQSGVNKNMFLNLKYLRTLILCDYNIKQLPTSIGRLKLLRYIDIRRTRIIRLPASYTKLYNLQTLIVNILEESSRIFLGTLINLRHINLHDDVCRYMLVGIKQLLHLQTLPYYTVNDENGCKIEELGPLEDLRGKLIIYRLDKVKNGEEARKANLSGKPKLDHLVFHWARKRKELNLNDEDVLEGLKPHLNLKSLTIECFKGSNFPSWMMTPNDVLLRSLVEVKLLSCDSCEQLPSLGHLPHLKCVLIQEIKNVKRIGIEFYGCTNLERTSCAFPSLTTLKFFSMKNLEEWLGPEHPLMSSMNKAFPRLTHLDVWWCNKLTDLPSLQGLSSLTELTHLGVWWCEKLVVLPRGLELCTSLKTVKIINCHALQGVDSSGLERLPSLATLEIGDFSRELDYFPWPQTIPRVATGVENSDDVQLYFASLEKLMLWGWPKLTSLPEQLQHLPSLRSLKINSFEGLEILPEWLGNIQSLQSLELRNCENLKYLPSAEAMRRLSNLQGLTIFACDRLRETCTKGSGQEWHKVAHIPKIVVDHLDIQSQN